jgi:hypothetical protein
MGYYVSLELQVKTRKTRSEINSILNTYDMFKAHEAEINGKGTHRYLYYNRVDFKYSPESEAALLLMLLDLEPVHEINNGKQPPNLAFWDDLECHSWAYIISFGQIQPMRASWDYDTEARPLSRGDLLTRLSDSQRRNDAIGA